MSINSMLVLHWKGVFAYNNFVLAVCRECPLSVMLQPTMNLGSNRLSGPYCLNLRIGHRDSIKQTKLKVLVLYSTSMLFKSLALHADTSTTQFFAQFCGFGS